MFETILDFVLRYKIIILFYLVLGVIIFIYRKRFETQAKVILLLRTKWGIAWMDRMSEKYREWIILLGYIGIGVGFIGMGFIGFYLIKNLYDVMTNPAATNSVSLVLPGINVPGLGILPFWHWLIAIFVIAVVHEFAHGVVARAHKVDVKNTGIVFFGPILGAFVEPDEKKMAKEKDTVQYSILAAGAFSNILLALLALLLLAVAFAPLEARMQTPVGFTFDAYAAENLPFALAGIKPGDIITSAEGKDINQFEDLAVILAERKPGDKLHLVAAGKEYDITLAANPDDAAKPYVGITSIRNEFTVKEEYSHGLWLGVYYSLHETNVFLRWLYLLSFGIGIFNLLPLPIVDGGRMVQTFMRKLKGQVLGDKRYAQIGMFFLIVLILNLVYPWIAKAFSWFGMIFAV